MKYHIDVSGYRPEKDTFRSLVFFNETSLNKGVEEGFRYAAYYLKECDYSKVELLIEEFCEECGGEGKVFKKRGWEKKVCPKCKGKNSSVELVRAHLSREVLC